MDDKYGLQALICIILAYSVSVKSQNSTAAGMNMTMQSTAAIGMASGGVAATATGGVAQVGTASVSVGASPSIGASQTPGNAASNAGGMATMSNVAASATPGAAVSGASAKATPMGSVANSVQASPAPSAGASVSVSASQKASVAKPSTTGGGTVSNSIKPSPSSSVAPVSSPAPPAHCHVQEPVETFCKSNCCTSSGMTSVKNANTTLSCTQKSGKVDKVTMGCGICTHHCRKCGAAGLHLNILATALAATLYFISQSS